MRSATDFITLVSGPPRSGTSMMMRMLEHGGMPLVVDREREADHDNPLGYYEYEPVKQLDTDSSWVAGCRGRALKVIYLLLYDLPADEEYRVVFMHRSLDEMIASQDAMIARRGERAPDIARDELKRMFDTQLGEVRAWLSGRPNFHVLDVRYDQAVADPAATAAAVARFLEAGLDVRRMAAAVDPTLYRQGRAAAVTVQR